MNEPKIKAAGVEPLIYKTPTLQVFGSLRQTIKGMGTENRVDIEVSGVSCSPNGDQTVESDPDCGG